MDDNLESSFIGHTCFLIFAKSICHEISKIPEARSSLGYAVHSHDRVSLNIIWRWPRVLHSRLPFPIPQSPSPSFRCFPNSTPLWLRLCPRVLADPGHFPSTLLSSSVFPSLPFSSLRSRLPFFHLSFSVSLFLPLPPPFAAFYSPRWRKKNGARRGLPDPLISLAILLRLFQS